MEQRNDDVEIDLMELFYVLKSKIVLILLVMVIFGIGSGLFTHYLIRPMYSSTSSIYVLTNETVLSYADLQIGNSLTSDYIQMIKSRTVLETVVRNLHMEEELDYESFSKCVGVSNPSDTRILNLTVTYSDPRIAKELVDELADVSIERISYIMDTKAPNIFERGCIRTVPVSPHTKKNIVIAAMFGFVLISALIIIFHLMDDTIHSPEDIEKYLSLNTLAAIPVAEGADLQIKADDRKRRGKRSSKK